MASSDVSNRGEPLQIIRITSKENDDGEITHGLELVDENLEKIMLHPEVKENPVVIISITGAFRKGKSFLLGFFLKFLETQPEECDWLSEDDKIEGFEWRGGSDRVTSGILIWSEPFIRENKFGEKVAVLLMDTQGVFDDDSTVQDCANIFALVTMISSVQIWNVMQQVQEDDLQHLEFFTEFGKLVNQKSDEGDVNGSKFIFLIRDWSFPYENAYGKDGGNAYIRKKLKIKKSQHNEQKNIRRNLEKCFPNIGGFLLPYPGKAIVTNQAYNGLVKELDGDFVENVKLLIPYILSKEMLVARQINNTDVTGQYLLKYVKVFVSLLRNDNTPTLETALKATAAVGRQLAINAAFEFYNEEMDKICNFPNCEFVPDDVLESHHKRLKVQAREKLKEIPRLQILGDESECLEQLNNLIAQKYDNLKKLMEEKQLGRNAVAAKEKAESTTHRIKTAVSAFGICVGTVVAQHIGVEHIGFIGEYIRNDLSTNLSNLL
eukprot:XP_019922668.1 PREDICTED: atlastin-1 isoform X2 [Crassostrea gigas]